VLLADSQKEGDALMTKVNFTAEDEQQLLAEKPALRQIYDAQVQSLRHTWSLYGVQGQAVLVGC
jgi:hypothetical protein